MATLILGTPTVDIHKRHRLGTLNDDLLSTSHISLDWFIRGGFFSFMHCVLARATGYFLWVLNWMGIFLGFSLLGVDIGLYLCI
jgi:hypothetical protein